MVASRNTLRSFYGRDQVAHYCRAFPRAGAANSSMLVMTEVDVIWIAHLSNRDLHSLQDLSKNQGVMTALESTDTPLDDMSVTSIERSRVRALLVVKNDAVTVYTDSAEFVLDAGMGTEELGVMLAVEVLPGHQYLRDTTTTATPWLSGRERVRDGIWDFYREPGYYHERLAPMVKNQLARRQRSR